MSTSARVGYNGVVHESGTHWQLLGNGRRAYNPVLMRFHSPDRLSPFGRGGINAYAYCVNDPINLGDPSGQFAVPLMALLGVVGGVGAAGAGALASSGSSGDSGGGSSALPWIIGGAITAVSMLAGAGMVGRQRLMKLGNSSAATKGGSWANRAGGTSTGLPTAAPVGRPVGTTQVASVARSRSPSPVRSRSPSVSSLDDVRRDKSGIIIKDMSELPSPVRDRIVEIRNFGPRSKTADPTKVRPGKAFDNAEGLLPPDRTGTFYHRYVVKWGAVHDYREWRIVTGSTYKQGLLAVFVTPSHDKSFFKVTDWSRF